MFSSKWYLSFIFIILMDFLTLPLEVQSQNDYNKILEIFNDLSGALARNVNRDFNISPDLMRKLMKRLDFPIRNQTENSYDFIIVGGGSAGSVIASRLSEIAGWNVLLLEAGVPENAFSSIPQMVPLLQVTHYNWQLLMEYDNNFATAMDNQLLSWPKGKALGGSSVINYMLYMRGNRRDYDSWAAQGNPGWSYAEVLPYFMKSEKSSLERSDREYHGYNGYLSVSDSFTTSILDTFIRAGGEFGYNTYHDYNGREQLGFGRAQTTQREGRRHSVARAFLYPVRNRKNLHIVTSAVVTKILIDPNVNVAYGVEYVRNDRTYTVYAKKEVILSASAFHSPQLLMLSGVGPRSHLESLGIPVLKDLPVGENLQDHIGYMGLGFKLNQSVTTGASNIYNPIEIIRYLKTGKGVLAGTGGVEGLGYVNTEMSTITGFSPDIEMQFQSGTFGADNGYITRRIFRITKPMYDTMFKSLEGQPSWSIFPLLLHPKSRGSVRLRSRNPFDAPLLYGNYLSDPEDHDMKTMIAAIRFIMRLSKTNSFQRYGSEYQNITVPGCESFTSDSDDYWRCAIKTFSGSLFHQIGTCKMGPANDKSSVVSNELKVHGIGRLRVADISIMPTHVSAHTNAPAIMIGEKASDLIKSTWRSYL